MSAPEFDGTPMTKREVLIARDAYEAGVSEAHANQRDARRVNRAVGLYLMDGGDAILDCDALEKRSASRYPLPKVTRPRVVTIDNTAFRFYGGVIQMRHRLGLDGAPDVWSPAHIVASRRIVEVWAALVANPTEEVEAEE